MSEEARFWSHVLKGPKPEDCWFWTGAIGDDGYGRFWVKRPGTQQAVRPQRYSHEVITGRTLDAQTLILHECDNPLCVHADADPILSHLSEGTHRQNMLDRAQKGRGLNRWGTLRSVTYTRSERATRSRALRAALLEFGWNPEKISAAIAGIDSNQPTLF